MWVVGDTIMVAVGLWAAMAAMVAEERRLVARERAALAVAGGRGDDRLRRALLRWLTRRSRVPAVVRLALAVILAALAVVGIAAPSSSGQPSAPAAPGGALPRPTPDKSPEPPGPGDPTRSFPNSPALRAEGFNLYQSAARPATASRSRARRAWRRR